MFKKSGESRESAGLALGLAVVFVFSGGIITGCANPGPPRPPSLRLPALVKDLSAERIGDRVLLRWTTPSRTTDGLETKGSLTAEICRSVGPTGSGKKSLAACDTVRRIVVTPGASSAYDDLPQALRTDPVTLLVYRVEIFNAANRSAGKSTAVAYAAAGAAPPPVASLTATDSEAGAVLKWNNSASDEPFAVDLSRTDLSAPPAANHKPGSPTDRHNQAAHLSNSESPDLKQVHLRAAALPSSNGHGAGTVDTSAAMGETYSYVAQQARLIIVDGHQLELHSLPSSAVTLTMRDSFPPKTPSGLTTIPGVTEASSGLPPSPYIDLSWEANSEPDLAGYLVYRQLARPNGDPQGPLGRLTALPISAPAYRDVAVAPGQRYIYSVTAVDASGNESVPSAKAQEVATTPNVVGSPQ